MSQIKSVKRVVNNALQGELIDTNVQTSSKVNVLAELNIGDPRFRRGSTRHAWFAVTMASLEALGIPQEQLDAIEKLAYGESIELNFEHPMVAGQELAIQISESTTPYNEYEEKNSLKVAKQLPITPEVAANKGMRTEYDLSKFIGQTGYFTDGDENLIYTRATVGIKGQIQHRMIESPYFVPSSELEGYGATLVDASKSTVKEEDFKEEEQGA